MLRLVYLICSGELICRQSNWDWNRNIWQVVSTSFSKVTFEFVFAKMNRLTLCRNLLSSFTLKGLQQSKISFAMGLMSFEIFHFKMLMSFRVPNV